jgi:hypothetical protein
VLPRVFPVTGSGGPSTVGTPAAVNPDLSMPYSMQYNFTLEHSRWQTGFRFSYIGTNTRQGDWSYNYNSPVPDDRLYVDKPRPFPQFPVSISYFTWIYQLPFGTGKPFMSGAGRAANLLVGGWEVSGIYSLYSGQFLTPFWSGPDPVGISPTSSRSRPIVTIRPDHLRDANLPEDQRAVNRWFDPTAFAGPPVGCFGNSAKGFIKGPGVNVWHVGFFKNFNFTERMRLRWELTASNFFNHPNYSNPNTTITQTANVGVISGVGGVNGASTGDQPGSRSFRTGLRFES